MFKKSKESDEGVKFLFILVYCDIKHCVRSAASSAVTCGCVWQMKYVILDAPSPTMAVFYKNSLQHLKENTWDEYEIISSAPRDLRGAL